MSRYRFQTSPKKVGTSAPKKVKDPEKRTYDSGIWESSVLLALAFFALASIYQFWIYPLIFPFGPFGRDYWAVPSDVWIIWEAGRIVARGEPFGIYQAFQYQSGPLLPILVAPAAFIGKLLGLTDSYSAFEAKPTAWLLFGPYATMLSSVALLYSVRRLLFDLGVRTHLLLTQTLVGAFALTPVLIGYGHFDDMLALAAVILSAGELARHRWMRAAIWMGAAVLFKQWALLAVPTLFFVTPSPPRWKSLLPALAVPAAYFAVVFATDGPAASKALVHPNTFPSIGHAAAWIPRGADEYIAGNSRMMVFLIAIGVAWLARNRDDPQVWLGALGIALLARIFFEPAIYSYYPIPGMVFLALHEAATHRRVPWRVLSAGLVMQLLMAWHPTTPLVWWAPILVLSVIAAWPAAVRLVSRREDVELSPAEP